MVDISITEQKRRELEEVSARLEILERERTGLLERRSRLLSELDLLRAAAPLACEPSVNERSSPQAKVALFRTLFRGREDVYAARWQGRSGKSGFVPVCRNEWRRPQCGKPQVKCGGCAYRELEPLTDDTIIGHLTGRQTIGIYPLLPDDSCHFLAIDLDGPSWHEDVHAVMDSAQQLGIPAYIERSRSGNGAHTWVFFTAAVPADQARALGSLILTVAMDRRHQLGLSSYDRLFPNQDRLPKGGFGNLIALPPQKQPRAVGAIACLSTGA